MDRRHRQAGYTVLGLAWLALAFLANEPRGIRVARAVGGLFFLGLLCYFRYGRAAAA